MRLYTEARTDRKLDTLTDPQHRVWFALMCYAFEQSGKRMSFECSDREELAVECAKGDTELLNATIARLVKPLKMLEVDGDSITFINGEARQYDKPSDTPSAVAKRVTKHRSEVSRDVTPCNAEKRAETRCHADSPLEESREEKSRKSVEPRAEKSDVPAPLANYPDCMNTQVAFMRDGVLTDTIRGIGHINRALEAKGYAVSEADRGKLGAAIKATCPKGCNGYNAFDCTRLVCEKVEKAHTLATAIRFVRSDARC